MGLAGRTGLQFMKREHDWYLYRASDRLAVLFARIESPTFSSHDSRRLQFRRDCRGFLLIDIHFRDLTVCINAYAKHNHALFIVVDGIDRISGWIAILVRDIH